MVGSYYAPAECGGHQAALGPRHVAVADQMLDVARDGGSRAEALAVQPPNEGAFREDCSVLC